MKQYVAIWLLIWTATESNLARAAPPVASWAFNAEEETPLLAHGSVHRDVPGPRPPEFPDFEATNTAVKLDGRGAHFSFADPGAHSPFDFTNGDSVTLEAWLHVDDLRDNENLYIIGKGRTGDAGFAKDNQNWALRIRGVKQRACVSFLFATPREAEAADADSHWHRWTTQTGFAPRTGWHHIAVAYAFGEPDSIRGWIDGSPVEGAWDMGGPTKAAPVVDDDAIWIGSSQGGNAGNSLRGSLDAIAIHRALLDDKTISSRFNRMGGSVRSEPAVESKPDLGPLPPGRVLATFHEGMPSHERWLLNDENWPAETMRWETDAFLLHRLPLRYDDWGIRESWKAPVLIRLAADVKLPPGRQVLLVRARGLSRLWVNGQVVGRTKPLAGSPSGEEPITPVANPPLPGLRAAGHREQEIVAEVDVPGEGELRVVLEALAGGAKFRAEPGELCVAVRTPEGESFSMLRPAAFVGDDLPLTDAAVEAARERIEAQLTAYDDQARRTAAAGRDAYWSRRHEAARRWALAHPAPAVPAGEATHPVDAFLAARLKNIEFAPVVDDATFMRRVYLDTIGVPPSEAEARALLSDTGKEKRRQLIDRLLADPRWADHWVSYWQDVLAENPTLINASLNSTGPFRWFLYDALRDDKPLDRMVTELVMMRGSEHDGGSAGFGLAAQNDAPLAAKGHILASALLGIELQCARCHDSPYHRTTQRELYSLAAMLARKTISVPKSSSVPAAFFEKAGRESLIQVTLKPGEPIEPVWPFAELTGAGDDDSVSALMNEPDDTREKLAVLLTAPQNVRFAQVVVNRVWRRLMGAGIVEPAHDWEGHQPSHPELLQWLAHEFVAHGYSVKHVARWIMTSQAYAREAVGHNQSAAAEDRFFQAPDRRRMTAEQIVDAYFAAAGQPIDVEDLTFDPDGRRPAGNRQNLGRARRAWMFASLSNERDRPSLTLPRAAAVCDVMTTFGWSAERQTPVHERHAVPDLRQPGVLANSALTVWLTRAAEGSVLADVAVTAEHPAQLIDTVFLRFLSRLPRPQERDLFLGPLSEGFATRVVPPEEIKPGSRPERLPQVTWSNHLRAEASTIQQEWERRVRLGPPPDARLRAEWREVYEDMVWSVVNLREFVWMP